MIRNQVYYIGKNGRKNYGRVNSYDPHTKEVGVEIDFYYVVRKDGHEVYVINEEEAEELWHVANS